jgi:hypothetical protein
VVVADLSEFHNAEAGITRRKPPTTTFAFKPGAEVGEVELYIDGDEEPQQALDRWASLLLGLDYGTMQILEVLEVRAWGENPSTGEPYRYVKAAVKKDKTDNLVMQQAVDRWLARHPRKPRGARVSKKSAVRCAEWWPITDTQIGKGGEERFGGLTETMARLEWVADALVEWHDGHKQSGYTPERIIVPFAGDMTEGCFGSYDNQLFVTSMNAADQLELAISKAETIVERALDCAQEVILTGVASNHDRQSRMSSKENVTDAWDDRTFTLLRSLARVYSRLGFDRVKVIMPNNPHVSVIEDGFLTVGTIHGHKPKYKGTAANTMWEWWKAEIAARRDAAACSVLQAGHYHHSYHLGPQSGRLLIGLPSLDGGSAYFEAQGGDWSLPGVSPYLTTEDGVRKLDMLVWPEDRKHAREQIGGVVA